ncbi:hypothetical protein [Burkholderia ambifaria]|uniref:hypothetical protein n=1 Tax=Burkholderia ambifaria TaxID=152480 RepID=UPI00158B4B24|nr:hypothetical protein [Burkholderia ambifaria]
MTATTRSISEPRTLAHPASVAVATRRRDRRSRRSGMTDYPRPNPGRALSRKIAPLFHPRSGFRFIRTTFARIDPPSPNIHLILLTFKRK